MPFAPLGCRACQSTSPSPFCIYWFLCYSLSTIPPRSCDYAVLTHTWSCPCQLQIRMAKLVLASQISWEYCSNLYYIDPFCPFSLILVIIFVVHVNSETIPTRKSYPNYFLFYNTVCISPKAPHICLTSIFHLRDKWRRRIELNDVCDSSTGKMITWRQLGLVLCGTELYISVVRCFGCTWLLSMLLLVSVGRPYLSVSFVTWLFSDSVWSKSPLLGRRQ